MLAFTCALAGASMWVMWCTRHSAHVSSSYSLISAVAGVGVATVGAQDVQWGWNEGQGLGAIFAGLGMAPAIAAGFGATIFMLIKLTVHIRKNPVKWAIMTSPAFFLIAGTVCTLSIVYKGSPNLKLNDRPDSFIIGVTLGAGFALAVLSAFFFVPFVYARVINRDASVKVWMIYQGPMLFLRQKPAEASETVVPNFAVVQDDDVLSEDATAVDSPAPSSAGKDYADGEKSLAAIEIAHNQLSYEQLRAQGLEKMHAKQRKGKGLFPWAMRYLHENKVQNGAIYEFNNMAITMKRIPAMIVVAALYGAHYDIHAAQHGVHGTPEGARMERVYGHAQKYANEVSDAMALSGALELTGSYRSNIPTPSFKLSPLAQPPSLTAQTTSETPSVHGPSSTALGALARLPGPRPPFLSGSLQSSLSLCHWDSSPTATTL
jgi:sodium-dependent phosphate transporter